MAFWWYFTPDAAAAGTSVFDQIASGNVQSVQDVTDVQDVKNVKDVNKKGEPLERLNLKIPAEIKEYLTAVPAKASGPAYILDI